MRFLIPAVTALALAGCATTVPESGPKEGFDNYDQAANAREAELRGEALATGQPPAGSDSQTAIASGDAAQTGTATAPVRTATNVGISDEQSFEAVTERETIESDRERLEQQRAQYKVIDPKPLPKRSGSGAPNVVAYAVTTTNAVGESLYRRSGLFAESRFERNCARYNSDERAQEDFLKRGGPKRDSLGLDPDGDGFACGWDPAPFRNAVK